MVGLRRRRSAGQPHGPKARANDLSLASLREAAGGGRDARWKARPERGEPGPATAFRSTTAFRRRLWPAGVAGIAVAVLSGAWLLLGPSAPAKLHPHSTGTRGASPPPAIAAPSPQGQQPGAPPPPATASTGAGPVDAASFRPGACIAFPPTGGDRHLTVFLDPGHGGPDPGALGRTQSGRSIDEAELTLPTVLDAVPLLQQRGYRVVVSRTGDSAVARSGLGDLSGGVFSALGARSDWTARAVCANLARAAVLVSVHFNAGASPLNAGMLTAYDNLRSFSAQSQRLATLLQADVLAAMNRNGWEIPDGGVKTDDSVGAPAPDAAGRAYGRLLILGPAAPGYLSTPSEMPGAVIEPLFLTDPFEGSIAAGAEGQQAIAAGIARAIDSFLSPGR